LGFAVGLPDPGTEVLLAFAFPIGSCPRGRVDTLTCDRFGIAPRLFCDRRAVLDGSVCDLPALGSGIVFNASASFSRRS
jgi:hypothetical protein